MVGRGEGPTKVLAKQAAAMQSLNYFSMHGIPLEEVGEEVGEEQDPVGGLNKYLRKIQGPKNLVPLLHFTSIKNPYNPVHTGTYTFREVVVGTGRGITTGGAQRAAARQALKYFSTYGIPGEDPVGDLNDYLHEMQGPKKLVSLLHFTSLQKDQVHTGTYTFREVVVGTAQDITTGGAQRAAASQALQYFSTHGIPGEDPVGDLNDYLHEIQGPKNLVSWLHFTSVQKDQVHTGTYTFLEVVVGTARDITTGGAQRVAARQALQYFSTHGIPGEDSVGDLNDYLHEIQGPKKLVPLLHFTSVQKDQIHTGTYTFREVVVGTGRGITTGGAQCVAASQALQYFSTHGIPGEDPVGDLNDYLHEIQGPKNLVSWLHFTSLQKDQVHTGTYTFLEDVVGTGRDITAGGAQRAAARQALQYFSTHGIPGEDSVGDLNDYLHEIQGPKKLVPLLHFTSVQKDQVHTGTYTFLEVVVGTGRGITTADAQRAAARQALQYFSTHGIPGEGPVGDLNDYLHEIQEPKNLVPLLHFTSVQTDPSQVHTGTYTFREVIVGTGRGITTADAQRAAARQALQYFSTHGIPGEDPVGDLNDYLHEIQGSKNLVPLLRFTSVQTNYQVHVHTGTYVFREVVVGTGRGITTADAQRAAARQALQYFSTHGIPGEQDPVGDLNDYLHEIQGPKNLVPLLHFTNVKTSYQEHTGTYTFREVVVGTGQGVTIAAAQREAARLALQYFYTRGIPGGNIEPYLTHMEIFLML
ncbi:hypothetical protein BJV78DRAFT_1284457 [Lactifluus subvellereus]|nr:hypothetical protein BJV78DRAFT_1284457 [Lactifluus subvellereus]